MAALVAIREAVGARHICYALLSLLLFGLLALLADYIWMLNMRRKMVSSSLQRQLCSVLTPTSLPAQCHGPSSATHFSCPRISLGSTSKRSRRGSTHPSSPTGLAGTQPFGLTTPGLPPRFSTSAPPSMPLVLEWSSLVSCQWANRTWFPCSMAIAGECIGS